VLTNQINHFRIDSALHFDGIFAESESDPRFCTAAGLNSIGLMSIGETAGIAWIGDKDNVTDAILQRHLLVGVRPMAPTFGNDHGILPGTQADELYDEYYNLFEATRGGRWWLGGEVEVNMEPAGDIGVNMFETDEAFVLVSVLFDDNNHESKFTLAFSNLPDSADLDACETVEVGGKEGKSVRVTINSDTGDYEFANIPMTERGVVMIKCYHYS